MLVSTVGQSPQTVGYPQARWTLATIREQCDWLRVTSLGGMWQVLKRLQLGLKRGRHYVHSPDPEYAAKLAYVQTCLHFAQTDPDRYVAVYLDEVGYSRQPSLAADYAPVGRQHAPLARRSHHQDTVCRGLGALHPLTGQVCYVQFSTITTRRLVQFYTHLHTMFPHAETIFVIQDNWPVHNHPDVLAALLPQDYPFSPPVSASWKHLYASPLRTGSLPIQMVFLPTYSPWLNPIEKLWRWLKQHLLHLHPHADTFDLLKQRVLDFIRQFEQGSPALLRYVGLLPD
ncbi:MAG: IS630 family transposase [Anaerolineae bacterium]|nr:IS630 family transposase [Anaerolineae bacterium]